MKLKLSLKNKISFFLILIIFLSGALSTLVVFWYTKNTTLTSQKSSLRLQSFKQAETLDSILNDFSNSAGIIARLPAIINYLEQVPPQPQSAEILNQLKIFDRGNNEVIAYILNTSGVALSSLDPAFVGNNYSFRPYFKDALSGQDGMEMAIGVTSKKPGYYFSSPVKNAQGKIIGVAVLKVPESLIIGKYFMQGDNPDTNLIIADQDGIVIATNKEKQLYNSLGAVAPQRINWILAEQKFSGHEIRTLSYEPLQYALPNIKEATIFEFYDAQDKEQEIISMAPAAKGKFYIISEDTADIYTGIANKISLLMSLFVLISSLLGSLIAYLSLKHFLSPLAELEKGATELSKGNLKYKVTVKSGDELEHLANSFNFMAKNLYSVKNNIEEQVKTRTQELEKAFLEIEKNNQALAAINDKITKTTQEEQSTLQKLTQANNGLSQARKIMQAQTEEIKELQEKLKKSTENKIEKPAEREAIKPE